MKTQSKMNPMQPMVSVIIPVYKVEKYIEDCLTSVREQTLENLEIICVDDRGMDDSVEIVKKMAALDKRIKLYSNDRNQGLAFSRNAGLSYAQGKYVYFLDSDDMILPQAMEELTFLSEKEELDAAVFTADFIYEDDSLKEVFSTNPSVFKGRYPETLSGRELYLKWMEIWDWMPSQPRFFYRKQFLDEERIRFHNGMLHEDETFAFDVLMKADRIHVYDKPYFIRRFRADSIMTGAVSMKNVEGCLFILKHVNEYMQLHQEDRELVQAIDFYKRKIEKNAREKLKTVLEHDHEVDFPDHIELLSERLDVISDQSISLVSFDLFDTLLLRPLPGEDIKFSLLDEDYYRMTGSYSPFYKLRIRAEADLRRKIIRKERETEEISLEDIYQVLQERFQLPASCASYLKMRESELEVEFCRPRAYGRMLYERALAEGKRIVITSDMYLDRQTIERLLEKNGYKGWESIYLSSQCGKRKLSGKLYRELIEKSRVDPEHILHIGDNVRSDVEMAYRCGLRVLYLPATRTVFEEHGCMHQTEKVCHDLVDWEKASREAGIRIFRQMAANRYFDDPFHSFDSKTDYNRDPWFLGYAALGPQLLSLTKWIAERTLKDGVSTIFFLSRDGFLPMKAYRLYRQNHPELPGEQYLYASRIALLPAMLRSTQDFYDLPVDMHYQTPEKVLKLLHFCTRSDSRSEWMKKYRTQDHFDGDSYNAFIEDFLKYGYDSSLHRESIERIRDYLFKGNIIPLSHKTAVFDMGYSGRIPGAMSYAAKVDFPVYYFHGDGNQQFHIQNRSGIKIRTFLDFNPYMESTLREYAYLEAAPSCIGYDSCLHPLFDLGPAPGYSHTAEQIQKGALDFVSDFMSFFGGREGVAEFRYLSAALPFEAFLRHCSPGDRDMYAEVLMDDELWGGRRDIDLKMLMETRLSKLPAYAKTQDWVTGEKS